MIPVFGTVLVANRGEIARRIIRTLRVLGVRSVAVHSDADAEAPHVREADEAVRIGPSPASESYLDVEAIVAAARRSGAQAVHPGYGFLSESASLARACAEQGIVFIGPGMKALEVMADKARARRHVAEHGVPIVPGFDAAGMTEDEIALRAAEIGFPLLVKPSAGGGGKGMEVVADAAGLRPALASAQRVAAASFGDDALVIERLIRRPRHLEVQVFGDARGRIVAIGERECTLQRRHQKVIEEAPAAGITTEMRERLWAEAVRVAESVAYLGAGTVEFLVDADAPEELFFIEMNTRLQVEHPVTEAVTGLDLVELQLRVAAGEALPAIPAARGHAVEARVYAESPERGFLPSTGTILRFDAPEGVRVDAAVETGSEVTGFYDPMIAKVIAHAGDRSAALGLLDEALAQTVVLGVETNIAFLRTLCADERVRAGDLDTGLIETLLPFSPPDVTPRMTAAAAAAMRNHAEHGKPRTRGFLTTDLVSRRAGEAWGMLRGWRLAGDEAREDARALLTDDGVLVNAPSEPADTAALPVALASDGSVWVAEAGRTVRLRPLTRRQRMEHRLAARHPEITATAPEARAPMPGGVVAVHVADGASVRAGDVLVSIEAMKMEHPVTAPHDGVVRLLVALGDQVRRDQTVARVEAEGNDDRSDR
ncbi:acetyl/propionyl/methylcrotonyl-CoA carboxylase subunit alpha [Microbacterium tumbae]